MSDEEKVEIWVQALISAEELARAAVENDTALDKVFEYICEGINDHNATSLALASELHEVVMPLVQDAFIEGREVNYTTKEARLQFDQWLPQTIAFEPRIGKHTGYVGHPKIEMALGLLYHWASRNGHDPVAVFRDVYGFLIRRAEEWLFENWVSDPPKPEAR